MDRILKLLLDEIKNNKLQVNIQRITDAYEFAKAAHKGQKRRTGEDYINHPLKAAILVAQLGLDTDTIIATILHDTLEDTDVTSTDIEKEFGKTVLKLVEGVTSLRKFKIEDTSEKAMINARKMILASTDDIRILIIKLSDRLHNARTINGLPDSRKVSYAKEILYVFAHLSEYFGLRVYQKEFQDIAFKTLKPDEYARIKEHLLKNEAKHEKKLQDYIDIIKVEMKKEKINAQISGREKGIYSIYEKIKRKQKEGKYEYIGIDGIYDILATRIIVDSIEDCYRALGVLHKNWSHVPAEFDDYISNPKPNGYRSIHTVLQTKRWGVVEAQIRTVEMDNFNEFGPASHISYKLGGSNKPNYAFGWVSNLVRWQKDKNNEEKNFKIDLFKNNIYVFTPKGELIELPQKSCPIDFAYKIHTNVGNACNGAKVNGKVAPLSTKLKTGDKVEILINKAKQFPKRDWLEFVVSPNAKANIRRALREQEKFEAYIHGKEKLFDFIRKENELNEMQIEKLLIENLNNFRVGGITELYERVGHGLLKVEEVVRTLFPKVKQSKVYKVKRIGKGKVLIDGEDRLDYAFAKCCNPKNGDKIIAYVSSAHKIIIHKSNCKTLNRRKNIDKNKMHKATWDKKV